MQTGEFLAAVCPWGTGYVTIHWHRTGWKRMPGASFLTLDEALVKIDELQKRAVDVYYCTSSQQHGDGQRSGENAVALRVVPFDFDIAPDNPNKYPSIQAAIVALLTFCGTLALPLPSLLVSSGRGLHVYWISGRDLPADDWLPYAGALKAAALASGLKIDPVVTGDTARVLRVLGTSNHKYGKPIPTRQLAADRCHGQRYDFSKVFEKILAQHPGQYPKRPSAKIIPIAKAFQHLDPNIELAGGLKLRELPPLPFAPIKDRCAWLRHAHDTGGTDYDQPQWNLTSLCAVFLEHGSELVHAFGNKHPKYTAAETNEMWERKNEEHRSGGLGWPLCRTVSGWGGKKFCDGCALNGKGKSPLHIGYEAIKDQIIDKELDEVGGIRPPELRLPEGFALARETRHLCAFFRQRTVKKQVLPAQLLYLISNEIRSPDLQFRNGYFGVSFAARTDRTGETEVFIGGADLLRPNLLKLLAVKGLQYNIANNIAEIMITKFASSWLEKLMREDEAVRDPGTMGWRYHKGERTGFCYGGKLYHRNGAVMALAASADDEFRSWYQPVGKREVWLRAAKLLTDRRRPELDCILAVAFAAPLTVFAGTLYGAIFSVWGPPGTSKSTAQQVAAAVWGHPKQTRESLTSTAKSVQGRLGRTRNLPAYWDDVQDERHQQALFDTMFVAAEGTEGGRLHVDASYKVRLEWQTLLVACSNASFVEYLARKQKSTTAGMRRVFEVEFHKQENEPGIINHVEAGQAFAALEHNFGMIGSEYAKILATEPEAIQMLVTSTTNKFMDRVKGTSDESFWWGLCGVLLAGGFLAQRLGAEINLHAMEDFLMASYLGNRSIRATEGTEGGTLDHTTLAVTGFLNHFVGSGHVLFTNRIFEHRAKPVDWISGPLDGRTPYIQIARDTRTIMISQRALREWLEKNNIGTRQVFAGLRVFFHATTGRNTIGAGTAHALTQETCYRLEIPKNNDLFDQLVVAQGEGKPELHVVKS